MKAAPLNLCPIRLLVYDLDGTLIDSSADLCAAVNATLRHLGRSSLTEERITGFIGDGAAKLVERALAASEAGKRQVELGNTELPDEALPFFLHYYGQHKLDETRPYPGVLEALGSIRRNHPHLPMAVLTNKPVRPSREICDAVGLSPFFFAIYGGDSFAKKPDPEGLRSIVAEANTMQASITNTGPEILPANVVMIGDSAVDVTTARRCGTRCLGCSYGLAPEALKSAGPDSLVSEPGQWESALGL